MEKSDTIKLLEECNSGIRMGVTSIDDVIDKVENDDFRRILNDCRERHCALGSKTHELLNSYGQKVHEPNTAAQSMSKIMTQIKTTVKPGDATIADMITQGCNMGVKSLNKYLNEYSTAHDDVKGTTQRLINLEKKLSDDIARFL